ncbi:TRAP-type C4-dicarboxylate transport system, small permease component [Cohaesibacter sp. ES.047]|uniref:TRAP transporter small permease n=1 Tax=Cohaesibacter sp. ES.047 TaxID=1798205 RepID=UPI000BB7F510|nr:TRAP transporter small permease [Cohaesibacter sp. ES.047]SNY92715.1 TRAP-type C4-dicarboxylate transport system, small permease component [Cohaesibacter sp. ES.047]
MNIFGFLDRHLERIVVTGVLMTTTITLVIQVFMRYVLAEPLVWAEELARYLLVWCTMVGASLAVKESRHIIVDFAPVLFGPRSIKLFSIISHTGVLVFCAVILYYSIPFVQRVMAIGQLSPTLQVPMWTVYLALPVGCGMAALRTIQAIYKETRKPDADVVLGTPVEEAD